MSELVSTRDPQQELVQYSEVILEGMATYGGLYTPLSYPQLSSADLQRLSALPYTDLFIDIKSRFIDSGMPLAVVQDIARSAYSDQNFPAAVHGNVVPVQHIDGNQYVQKLWLGPTGAFKDMALQVVVPEMDYILGMRGEHRTILGATSGDTASAAEAAIKLAKQLDVFFLSPLDGMSGFQKPQIGSYSGGNVHNISVPAPFGALQDLVKAIKLDIPDLSAVNSINWGRIVSQVPYYVSGYLQTVEQADMSIGDPVDFVVPSGNFGNMLAAYIARSMGVPMRRLIVATNENDVLHNLVQTGVYHKGDTTVQTSSPSMDIDKASNPERLFFDLMDHDPERLAAFMKKFESDGEADLAAFGVAKSALLRSNFDSGTSKHADRIRAIQWVHEQSQLVIDPHTADAVHVARSKDLDDGTPMVAMGTADPVKFEDTIQQALGFVPERAARFQGMEARGADGFVELGLSAEAVGDYIRRYRQN